MHYHGPAWKIKSKKSIKNKVIDNYKMYLSDGYLWQMVFPKQPAAPGKFKKLKPQIINLNNLEVKAEPRIVISPL